MYSMYVCIGCRCVVDVGVYVGMYSIYVCIGCRYGCITLLLVVGMYVVLRCIGCMYVVCIGCRYLRRYVLDVGMYWT